MGLSYTGSKCLLVTRVSGYRRVPMPPARTIPFISSPFFCRKQCGCARLASPVFPCQTLRKRALPKREKMNCSATEQSRLSANRVLHGKPQLAPPIWQRNPKGGLHLGVGEHRISRPAGSRLKLLAGDGDNPLGLQRPAKFTGVGGPIEQRFVVLKDGPRKTHPRGLLRSREM